MFGRTPGTLIYIHFVIWQEPDKLLLHMLEIFVIILELSNRYPATGGGVQVGIYHFFFILCRSKRSCLLHLQMARWRWQGQTIA